MHTDIGTRLVHQHSFLHYHKGSSHTRSHLFEIVTNSYILKRYIHKCSRIILTCVTCCTTVTRLTTTGVAIDSINTFSPILARSRFTFVHIWIRIDMLRKPQSKRTYISHIYTKEDAVQTMNPYPYCTSNQCIQAHTDIHNHCFCQRKVHYVDKGTTGIYQYLMAIKQVVRKRRQTTYCSQSSVSTHDMF